MNTMNAGQVQFSIQFNMDHMADIHICGICKTQFTSIDAFLGHKRSGCLANQNNCLMSNLLNPTPSIPLPLPGSTVTHVTTNAPLCTPSTASSRKQRRKPILLSTSPKVAHPATRSNSTPSQPCGASTSISSSQNVDDSPPVYSSGLPKTSSAASIPFPDIAKECARVTEAAGVQETSTVGNKSTMGKGKSALKSKCYKCTHEGCGFETAHLKDIIRHRRIHTGDKPFTCSFCQRCFTRKDKLQLHVRAHKGQKPFPCKLCPYAAVDGGSLKKHMRTHTKERPFKCQICIYASCNSSQLTTHLRTHTGDAPFHCSLCSAKFKISTDLRRHERIHTGEKPFKCSFCSYASALNSNLKSHVKNNHLGEKKFQCGDCSFTCCTKKQLRQHERTHPSHNPIKCPVCDFLCKNKRAFRRHEQLHSKEKIPKCPHCSFTARYRSQIPPHVRKAHPNLPKRKQSKKAVKRKRAGQVSKHEKKRKSRSSTVQLSGKKPFVCDKCQASFMRKDSFTSHMRQHDQVTNTMESKSQAVLKLQQFLPLQSAGSTSTADLTANTANQNQNNNSIFSELNPTMPSSDFEMLLSVINSQAPPNLISSDLEPSINTRSSAQKRRRKNTSQDAGMAQLPKISNSPVALPKRSRRSASTTKNTNASTQSQSFTIIQPEIHKNGNMVTLQVISHNADSQAKKDTPDKDSAGFNFSGQQFVLRQLPMVRNQILPQVPQLQTEQQIPPSIQPTNQQLIRSSVNHTTSCLPASVSISTPHRGFLPQFVNRSPFPANWNAVGNLSLTGGSLPQGLLNPTSAQGLQHQQPMPTVSQSLVQHGNATWSLSSNNLQANVMQPCRPHTTSTSTTPQMNQQPPSAQQNVSSSINQIQTCTHLSQPHTPCTTTAHITSTTNTAQTLTKYASWNSPINTQMGPLHVMPQHQLQGNRHQQNQHQQQQVIVGVAASQPSSVQVQVGHPLSTNTLTQQVVTQQQQHIEQMKQHVMFPHSNILHVPQLAPVTACNTLMSPSVIGDNMNITSFRVRTQGMDTPATQSDTTSSI